MFSIHFFDLNHGYTTNNFFLQWRVFQFWGRNLIFFKSTENFRDKTLHHKYLMSTTDHSNLDWIQFHIRTLHTYKGPNCGRSHIATMHSLPRWPSKFGWSSPKYFLYCQAILNPFSYKTMKYYVSIFTSLCWERKREGRRETKREDGHLFRISIARFVIFGWYWTRQSPKKSLWVFWWTSIKERLVMN